MLITLRVCCVITCSCILQAIARFVCTAGNKLEWNWLYHKSHQHKKARTTAPATTATAAIAQQQRAAAAVAIHLTADTAMALIETAAQRGAYGRSLVLRCTQVNKLSKDGR
jgi:hypothetical protein